MQPWHARRLYFGYLDRKSIPLPACLTYTYSPVGEGKGRGEGGEAGRQAFFPDRIIRTKELHVLLRGLCSVYITLEWSISE
jgi:hypothetical protein